jgi:choline dehydrogenase-like flavoprotein
VRTRALGGSSWRWTEGDAGALNARLRSRPLDPIDFERRVGFEDARWPIAMTELDGPLARAHTLMRLGPVDYTASPEDALPLGPRVETTLCRFAPPDVFQRLARELARSAVVTLFTGATVVGMREAVPGVVDSMRVATESGSWFEVGAREFVLAGGGIDNPRMLLWTPFGRPGERANPHDQVGRYFMEHLHVESGVLAPSDGRFESFAPYYHPHGQGAARHSGLLRVSEQAQREEGLMNTVAEFRPLEPALATAAARTLGELLWGVEQRSLPQDLPGRVRTLLGEPGPAMRALRSRMGRSRVSDRLHALVLTSEQRPLAANRVTLERRRDSSGVPLAKLHWEVAPADIGSIVRTERTIAEALERAGLGRMSRLWSSSDIQPRIYGCNHAIGTTRMSADARTGVVDENCRVHGMANLSIAGSSVMPTGGAVSVTLTLVALALRLADRLGASLNTRPIDVTAAPVEPELVAAS